MSENNQALTIPVVESLKEELIKRREAFLSQKINSYPRKNPILSDLGDCDRQIAYGVTNWKDKKLPSTDLQARFEVGHMMEKEMIIELMGMGFEFVGGQEAITVHGKGGILLATGRIDGFIKWQGEKIPVEFKSMHPNVYDQVESLEDFSKKPWLRKYTRQLMMYLFGHNKEYGLFGLTNCLGGKKWFILYLDYAECELMLQRLENVAYHLKNGTLPDRIKYKEEICGRCDFASICLPDIIRTEAEILTDPDLISELERREKLSDVSSEYNRLDKSIKKQLKGIEKGMAGDFFITGKSVHRDGYEVNPVDYWQTSIQKIGGPHRTNTSR